MTLLTEEEAKTKWCPFARVAFECSYGSAFSGAVAQEHTLTTVNRGEGLSANTGCIASQCMAWRAADPLKGAIVANNQRYEVEEARGYCGLAGKGE